MIISHCTCSEKKCKDALQSSGFPSVCAFKKVLDLIGVYQQPCILLIPHMFSAGQLRYFLNGVMEVITFTVSPQFQPSISLVVYVLLFGGTVVTLCGVTFPHKLFIVSTCLSGFIHIYIMKDVEGECHLHPSLGSMCWAEMHFIMIRWGFGSACISITPRAGLGFIFSPRVSGLRPAHFRSQLIISKSCNYNVTC